MEFQKFVCRNGIAKTIRISSTRDDYFEQFRLAVMSRGGGGGGARGAAGRAYDHLYDTTYAVGGARDFDRSATAGMMSAGVAPVPDGRNYFSGTRRGLWGCGSTPRARRFFKKVSGGAGRAVYRGNCAAPCLVGAHAVGAAILRCRVAVRVRARYRSRARPLRGARCVCGGAGHGGGGGMMCDTWRALYCCMIKAALRCGVRCMPRCGLGRWWSCIAPAPPPPLPPPPRPSARARTHSLPRAAWRCADLPQYPRTSGYRLGRSRVPASVDQSYHPAAPAPPADLPGASCAGFARACVGFARACVGFARACVGFARACVGFARACVGSARVWGSPARVWGSCSSVSA